MAQTLHNNVFTKLAVSLSNSATSISLLDGSGFPTPAVGDFYFATLVSISGSTGKEDDWEIVKVTGKPATNTLTVTRGQEGTAARAWDAYTPCEIRITAGTVIMPDGTQNLSNKTITSSTLDSTVVGGTTAAAGSFTDLDATTVDATNVEVTNLKAKDGTAAGSIADSTGVVTVASAVLTTADINGGTVDGATIGQTTAALGTFTDMVADELQLTGGSGDQGTLSWNTNEDTVALVVSSGESLQLGQEVEYNVRNNSGSSIAKGVPVMITGTLGSSGRITIDEMDATSVANDKKYLGITAEAIASGADGKVMYFGKVSGLNTSSYSAGDLLFLDTSSVGALTATEPSSGIKLGAAYVVHSHASAGVLMVRPSASVGLHDLHDVFVDSPGTGEIIRYNASNGLWETKTLAEAGIATAAQGSTADSALQNVVEDTTPQLGGNLDFNGNTATSFTSTGIDDNATSTKLTVSNTGIDVTGTITTDGLNFDVADGVEIDALESILFNIDSDNNQTGRVFGVRTNSADTLFTIQDTGNVGIGTTSPSSKLHVKGSNSGASAVADGTLIVEQGSTPSIQILSANTQTQSIKFGDPQDGDVGKINYSHNDNNMNFVANGSEAMRIDSSGNVGIGTASPDSILHLSAGSAPKIIIEDTANPRQNYIGIDGSDNLVLAADEDNLGASSSMQFRVDATERMRIGSSGSVGIGTSSPNTNAKFEVVSTSAGAVTNVIQLRNGDATAGSGAKLQFLNSTVNYATAGTSEITGVRYSGNYSALTFTTYGPTSLVERMRIDGVGNVGIGTASPDQLLDVGDHTATGDRSIRISQRTATAAQTYGGIEFFYDNSAGTTGVNAAIKYAAGPLRNDGELTFHTGASASISERLRIDHNGNVGIGTTSPSYKLTVGGNSNSANNVLTGSNIVVGTTIGIRERGNTAGVGGNVYASQIYQGNSGGGDLEIYNVSPTYSLVFGTNTTERMRIDSAGNVGIGTTSPDGKLNVFSASAGSVSADADADELVLENSGNVGLSLLTASTGESGIYFGNPGTNGQKDFYLKYYHESHATTANRRAFTFNTASTERMRIDSSGLVGIATTNPATKLEVAHATTGIANNISVYNSNTAASAECAVDWALERTGSAAKIRAARITAGKEQTWTTTASTVDGYLKFLTARDESLNEAMRITSAGNVLVGTSSLGGNSGRFHAVRSNTGAIGYFEVNNGSGVQNAVDITNAANAAFIPLRFWVNGYGTGSLVGSISCTTSGTSYLPTSDARLKENIRDYDNALADVMKLKPRKYSWKTDGSEDNGFVAQELLEIPEFANRAMPMDEGDDPKYGVDYMKFVAVLTGAIQEQQAMIEELKAEVAALKGE